MIKGSDNNLLKKYNEMLQTNKSFKKPAKFNTPFFLVCHYAGEVGYEISSFLDKNRDTVSEIINDTCGQSSSSLLRLLF